MPIKIELKLTVTIDNTAEMRQALKRLVNDEVLVGVPETKAHREGPITNASLALIHDKGSPARNIPARPFMEPGIKKAMPRIRDLMKQVGVAAIAGNLSAVQRGFESVGLTAQSAIRSRINEGIPPALKPSTIRARKRKGFQGTKPLVRSGQLRNAITYIVRKKKS